MEHRFHGAALLGFCALLPAQAAYAQTLQAHWWVPNQPVNAVVKDDAHNTVILGGEFNWLCPPKPFGMVTNAGTGAPEPGMQYPDGEVYGSVPDGNGGWFICGSFTHIGGQPRKYLARINANGSLHPWNPAPNEAVNAIERSGSYLIAGGLFSQIGGAARSNIAILDGNTGLATSWTLSGTVFNSYPASIRDLAVDQNTLYVVGEFWYAGGCWCQQHAVGVDLQTGMPTAWDPAPNQRVYGIELDGFDVFLAGAFDTIGGQPRASLARVSGGWGAQLQPFDAGFAPGTELQDVAIHQNTVYVAGAFAAVAGQNRVGFAAFNKTSGTLLPWDAQASAFGSSVEVMGSHLLVGGNFTFIGGASRYNAAAVDLSTGVANAWAPNGNSNVYTVSASAGRIFIGGAFTGRTNEGVQRWRVAALDATTGVPTNFDPIVSTTVRSLALSGNSLYIGTAGTFNIDGQARTGGAAVDVVTGNVLPWNPNVSSWLMNMQVSGSTVYLGGGFTSVGGSPRNHLAAVDATTGVLLPWNPNAGNMVRTMTMNGNTLHVGGDFTSIGATTRNHGAAFDISTGNLLPWDPNVTGASVYNISRGPVATYLQGPFQAVGGQQRFGLAAVDHLTGAVSPWYPGAGADVVDALGTDVYLGGDFTTMAGVPRIGLASVNANTGAATPWDPGAAPLIYHERWIRVIDAASDAVRVAGDFTGTQGVGHPYFASFGNSIAPQITVAVHAFLEGPYNSATLTMGDALRSSGVLPTTEPYSSTGFAHVQGGNEMSSAAVFGVTGNNAIVDWVVLELRDPVNPSVRIESRSALIQRDGDVVAVDGVSPVGFTSAPGSYRVALRHRNHLGVMTGAAVNLSAVPLTIDFANGATSTHGTDARKNVNGTRVLWAGNSVRDAVVKYVGVNNDRDAILVSVGGSTPTNTVSGYYGQDVNMDGVVKYTGGANDRDPILINIGAIPTAVRNEQLP